MSDPATFRLLAAAVYFVPALLWAVFAQSIWGFLRKRRPRSRAFVVLFIVGGLIALHYALWVLIALARSRATRVALLAASDADTAVLLGLGQHFARRWPVRADPPRPGWLGVNYGVAALAAIVFVLADLGTLALPGATSFVPFTAYLLAMAALTVWDVQRLARSGAWQPGRLDEATSADVIALALGFALVAATVAADSLGGATRRLLGGGPCRAAHALARAGRARVLPARARGAGASPAAPRRRLPPRGRRGRHPRRLRARAARGGVGALGEGPPAARLREEPLSRPAPAPHRGAHRGGRGRDRPGGEPAPALGPRAGPHRSPARELQRRGRPGDRRDRRSARPRARRGRVARAHGRGRALARARREACRHRRAGGTHRARDPEPGHRRPEPRAAARARARRALRPRAPPHPGRARARRAAGRGAPPLRAPRGLPLRARRSGRARPGDAGGVPPPPRGGRRDAGARAGGRRHRARRPREAPPGARQPARERARRHDRRGRRATHALGRGRQRARCRRARGARQRPRCAGGRVAAPLRAVLLDEAERYGPRARDRAAHDRGARPPDRGARGARAPPRRERRAGPGRVARAVTASGLLAASLYLVPALLWAIIARQLWAYLRT